MLPRTEVDLIWREQDSVWAGEVAAGVAIEEDLIVTAWLQFHADSKSSALLVKLELPNLRKSIAWPTQIVIESRQRLAHWSIKPDQNLSQVRVNILRTVLYRQ